MIMQMPTMRRQLAGQRIVEDLVWQRGSTPRPAFGRFLGGSTHRGNGELVSAEARANMVCCHKQTCIRSSEFLR